MPVDAIHDLLTQEREIQRHTHHYNEQAQKDEQCERFCAFGLEGFHTLA